MAICWMFFIVVYYVLISQFIWRHPSNAPSTFCVWVKNYFLVLRSVFPTEISTNNWVWEQLLVVGYLLVYFTNIKSRAFNTVAHCLVNSKGKLTYKFVKLTSIVL